MRLANVSSLSLAAAMLVGGMIPGYGAVTDPVGAVNISIPPGNVALAPVFVHPDSWQGTIFSISEGGSDSTITLNGAAFTSGEFDSGIFPNFYLEIIEPGANEGYVFDILSSTVDSITVHGLVGTDFAISSGNSVLIRAHMTIGDLFEAASGLSQFDAVTFYDDTGTPKAYFYVGSAWSSDFGTTDESSKPIYPGSGVVTAFASEVTLTSYGNVKVTPTKVPVYAAGINIVNAINPVDVLISSVGLETSLSDYEGITTYDFDGFLSSPLSYLNFPGIGMTSDFSSETTDTTNGLNAFVASVGIDKYWTVPAPYSP